MATPKTVFAVMQHGGNYELVNPPVRWSKANPAPNVPIPYEVAQTFLSHDYPIRDERDGTVKRQEKQFRFFARYEDIPEALRGRAKKTELPALQIEGAEHNGRPALSIEESASPSSDASPPADEPAPPSPETSAPTTPTPTTPTPEMTRAQAARARNRNGGNAAPSADPSGPTG